MMEVIVRNANMMLLALIAALVLCGCNTVQGVGKDLKQGGDAIERAAKK
jgi:entericidin B